MIHDTVASFWSSNFAPHGYCLLWRRDLILTHLISDLLIALAYFSIPFALIRFIRKRPEIEFGGLFWLFAVFILACGMTHVLNAWNLWHGDYGAEGVIKAITAAASIPTAIILWRILPQALAIPTPTELTAANARLSATVRERDLALARLKIETEERLKTQQALVQVNKIDAVSQLTGGIAHDFNNLLQAISGNIEMIAHNLDKRESIARWAANAAKAVERGANLAQQLLVFARARQLQRTRIDANPVIAGTLQMIEQDVGPNIVVDFDLSEAPCPVMTEAHQLELALVNLACNARDAMPEGGTLTISSSLAEPAAVPASLPPAQYVRIAVRDSGCGMTPEVASRALDPFFSTKGVGHGSGLGLSMAFGFARQCDGVLQLTSQPGKGTLVEIFLPLAEAETTAAKTATVALIPAPARVPVGPPPPNLLAGGPAAIALVDDDDLVRESLVDTLRGRGYAVRDFAHPRAFLAALDGLEAEVIVLDYMMPEMSGADLAREIRRRVPHQKIIIVSGYAEAEALDSLADRDTVVLRKPFAGADLIAAFAGFASAAA